MNVKEAQLWGRKVLKDNKVESPEASTDFLLRQVLGIDKTQMLTHPEVKISKIQELKFRRWVKKRSKHEPVWYITGKIEFMGLDLAVNQSVLIPRPETELLVEKILDYLKSDFKPKKIIDIGTGSGTIILSLANKISPYSSSEVEKSSRDSSRLHSNNNISFFASDISSTALDTAKKNKKNNNIAPDIKFVEGDLFGPWVGQKFDLVVANLPYVPHEDMATLAFDLTHYEPRVALDGGILGLEVYKRFIEELPNYLNLGARVYMEIGYDQGRYIEDFVHKYLPEAKVETLGDYRQIDRIVVIET